MIEFVHCRHCNYEYVEPKDLRCSRCTQPNPQPTAGGNPLKYVIAGCMVAGLALTVVLTVMVRQSPSGAVQQARDSFGARVPVSSAPAVQR
jgi:hypothetical protein